MLNIITKNTEINEIKTTEMKLLTDMLDLVKDKYRQALIIKDAFNEIDNNDAYIFGLYDGTTPIIELLNEIKNELINKLVQLSEKGVL